MSLYSTIRDAIINRRQITGRYRGCYREMCPHVLGTKNGHEQALFYQFGGESNSGLSPDGSPNNWRCLPVNDLEDVHTRAGDWHTGPRPSRQQTCVDNIDVQVEL